MAQLFVLWLPTYNMMLELKFQIEGIKGAFTSQNQGPNQNSYVHINFLSSKEKILT